MKVLITYIPVLHNGYIKLFKESNADVLYIISEGVVNSIPELDYITRKDSLRAISSTMMRDSLIPLRFFGQLKILDLGSINFIRQNEVEVVMPDEDVSRLVAEKYFPDKNVEFFSIFLRWNKSNVKKTKEPNCENISLSSFQEDVLKIAFSEAEKSLDWWRQVGGVIVKNESVIMTAFNKHCPTEQNPYIFGDPRAVFKKGLNIKLSTAEHAEAILIAEAARRGISLEGSDLFITDFPCPPCAKFVARSGIKRCFFFRGYAMLDGEEILKNKEVEIIRVKK